MGEKKAFSAHQKYAAKALRWCFQPPRVIRDVHREIMRLQKLMNICEARLHDLHAYLRVHKSLTKRSE